MLRLALTWFEAPRNCVLLVLKKEKNLVQAEGKQQIGRGHDAKKHTINCPQELFSKMFDKSFVIFHQKKDGRCQ